ncbi:restriction endonuclease, partial [archaeon]|nr:restriction endonuclease [archaeon]
KGVGLKITSWKYPKGESLGELIEKKSLYPITILNYLTNKMKEKLFSLNIIMLKDFEKYNPKELKSKTNFSEKEIELLLKEVYEVLA